MNDTKNDNNPNIQSNNDINIIHSNTEPLSNNNNNILQNNTTETNNNQHEHQPPKTEEELINEFLLRENEYKREIATLQSELKSLTNDELLINLKTQIKTINKQISKYISMNNKQRESLEELSSQLDKKLRLINFKHVSQKIKAEQQQQQQHVTLIQANDHKIKTLDQQIKNAKQLANIYTKDNEQLKMKYNSLLDVKSKYELIDKGKKYDIELFEKVKEMKMLKKQIEIHLKCKEEKNAYEQKIKTCLEELKIAKDKNEMLIKKKQHIDDIVKQYEYNKNKRNECNNNESDKGNNNNNNLLKNPSYKQFKLNQQQRTKEKSFRSASTKQLQINNNTNNNSNNVLDIVHLYFNDNDLNIIKNAYTQIELKYKNKLTNNNNKQSYDTFIKNIIILHNSKKSIEKKHQREIKSLLQTMHLLDEQLNTNKQEIIKLSSTEKQIQCDKEDALHQKETYYQQIQTLKDKQTAIKHEITKQNDIIQSISNEINEIRQVINNSEPMQLRDKLEQYIKPNDSEVYINNNSIGINTIDMVDNTNT